MATYPNAIKSFTNPLSTDYLNSPSHSTQHTQANDEINAIETELGVTPSGTFSTVVARLDNIETNNISYDAIIDSSGSGDYTDIEACMDANVSGGRFYIRNGTYPISGTNTIHVPSNTYIEGESKNGVVLTLDSNINVFQNAGTPGTNITVKSLTVNGSALPEAGTAWGKAFAFNTVQGLTIENTKTYHIMSVSYDIRNCGTININRNESDTDSSIVFYVDNTEVGHISNNYIHDLVLFTDIQPIPVGFYLYGNGTSSGDCNLILSNNIVKDVDHAGCNIDKSHHVVMVGNTFDSCDDWACWTVDSPHFVFTGNSTYNCGSIEGGDVMLHKSHNSIVSGNAFDESWRESVALWGANFCNVSSNQITDSGHWSADASVFPAIKLVREGVGTGATGNSVTSNMIVSSLGKKPSYPIQEMDSDCDYNHYIGNNCRGCTSNVITLLGSNSSKGTYNFEP